MPMSISRVAKRFPARGKIIGVLITFVIVYAIYEGFKTMIHFDRDVTVVHVSLDRTQWKWVVLPRGVTSYTVNCTGQYDEKRWMRLVGEAYGEAIITSLKDKRDKIIEGEPVFEKTDPQRKNTYSFSRNANRIKIRLIPNEEIWIRLIPNTNCIVTSTVGYDRVDESAFRGEGNLVVNILK